MYLPIDIFGHNSSVEIELQALRVGICSRKTVFSEENLPKEIDIDQTPSLKKRLFGTLSGIRTRCSSVPHRSERQFIDEL